jgi:hypothetical protein
MLKRLLALAALAALAILLLGAPAQAQSPVLGLRSQLAKGTTSQGQTSYAGGASNAGACVGGLITIPTGLPAGTVLTSLRVSFFEPMSNITTAVQLGLYVFDANPTGSTLADGSNVAIAAGDLGKLAHYVTGALTTAPGAGGNVGVWAFTGGNAPAQPSGRIAVDASGNIYAALNVAASGTVTFAAPGTLTWRAEFSY